MERSRWQLRVRMDRAACVFALVLIWFAIPAGRVWSQSPVSFEPTQIKNRFPNGISFEVRLSSPGVEVESAKFVYEVSAFSGPVANQKIIPAKVDGELIRLEYLWDEGYPPGAQLAFHWEVTLADGSLASSAPESYAYTDTNYQWTAFDQAQFSLYCHDRPVQFCQDMAYVTSKAILQQTAFYAIDPQGTFRVWVYNSLDEVKEWNGDMYDFTGGFAYPDEGVIVAIIEPDDTPENRLWVNSVIPHELSHLILNWKTANGLVDVPIWLNEGSAVYNEMIDKHDYNSLFKKMIKYDEVVPLAQLDLDIQGGDGKVIEQAYVESYKIVTYMLDVFGEAGYMRLLDAYKHSLSGDDAFYAAFRQTQAEFEAGWRSWVADPDQAKAGVQLTQAAYALTPGSTPTRARTATPTRTNSPTRLPSLSPTPSASPTLQSTSTPQPTPTPAPAASNAFKSRTVWIVLGTCLLGLAFGAVVLVGAGAAAFVARKRR